MPGLKVCGSCRATLPLSEFYKKKNGLQGNCKDCAKKYALHWISTHPDQFATKQAAWKKGNPESIRKSHSKWQKANAEHVRQYAHGRYQQNTDKIRAREQLYMKQQSGNLTDVWIRILARKAYGLKPRDLTPELIEATRAQLLLTRELRAKRPRKKDAYVCKGCGTTFKPKHYRPDGEGTHYCSRECFFTHRRGHAPTLA